MWVVDGLLLVLNVWLWWVFVDGWMDRCHLGQVGLIKAGPPCCRLCCVPCSGPHPNPMNESDRQAASVRPGEPDMDEHLPPIPGESHRISQLDCLGRTGRARAAAV